MQSSNAPFFFKPVELRVEHVSKSFGSFVALHDVSVTIPVGKVTAFVGPNGAGKTTLFHIIGGSLAPDSGKVFLNDEDITGLPSYMIHRRRVGRLFQDARIFPNLSVWENVQVSFLRRRNHGLWTALAFWKRAAWERRCRNRAHYWLKLVGLESQADRLAGELSFGQQKLLALARLAALRPSLMLLDEPTAALSPVMVEKVVDVVRQLALRRWTTVALIEHNMGVVRQLADTICFMNEGTVYRRGLLKNVLTNRKVRNLYMGLAEDTPK